MAKIGAKGKSDKYKARGPKKAEPLGTAIKRLGLEAWPQIMRGEDRSSIVYDILCAIKRYNADCADVLLRIAHKHMSPAEFVDIKEIVSHLSKKK